MYAQSFLNVIFLLILSLFIYFANSAPTPKSGPYRSLIVRVEDCTNLLYPFMTDPPMVFETSINNGTQKGTMLSGNLTVLRDTKNLKTKIRSFLFHNGKWELNYMINGLNCHGSLIHLVSTATKVKYDSKTCMYKTGSYAYKNLDVNLLQHVWLSSMEYGKLMWRVDAFVGTKTIICKEFTTTVEPL